MTANPLEVIRFVGRNGRRIAVSVAGGVVVLAGVAMLVLPGPGIVVIAIGFAILGTEYAWAAAALERTKRTAQRTAERSRRVARDSLSKAGRRVRRSGPK